MDTTPTFTTLFFSGAGLFFILAVGVILILWIAMPFGVFGIKDMLKRLILEQRRTNELLITLLGSLKSGSPSGEDPLEAPKLGDIPPGDNGPLKRVEDPHVVKVGGTEVLDKRDGDRIGVDPESVDGGILVSVEDLPTGVKVEDLGAPRGGGGDDGEGDK